MLRKRTIPLLLIVFLIASSSLFPAEAKLPGLPFPENSKPPLDFPIFPLDQGGFRAPNTLQAGANAASWMVAGERLTPTIPPALSARDSQSPAGIIRAPQALDAYAGGEIVFTSFRDGINEVYRMEADGSDQVNLSNNPGWDDAQPVIGPDGRIAFLSNRDGNLEIYVMEADGGNQTRLTNSAGDEGWMDWSPDGSRLVFVYHAGSIWRLETMNADGSGRTTLFEDNDDLYDATWSPDGNTIAFFWADSLQHGVYTIPAAGGSATRLPLGAAEEPAWSPDGTKLAVTLVDEINLQSWIYVTDLAGANPVQVSPGANFTVQNGKRTGGDAWPSWSPDGRRIVYASDWGGGFDMVYIALADGSTAATHTNLSASLATDYQPDWGPGGFIPPAVWGPLVAYQTGRVDQISSIHLYDSETAQDTVVAQGGDLRLAGLWADWLVYQKLNADGGYDIWVQEIDSGAATNISLVLAASTSNRPYVEGGRVYWRQVRGTETTIGAGFYEYDLVTGDAFLAPFPYPFTLFYRYSRYRAGDGRLTFIHESNQPALVDLENLSLTLVATGGAKIALPGGVSGNTLAALENGAGGNDVLATYVISPTSRTEITTGLDGPPALSGDFLAWASGGQLYRQHLFDEAAPSPVATDAGAFALDSGLLLWLDGQGNWADSQGDAASLYLGLGDFQGDADFTEPESVSVRSPRLGDWHDRWLAQVTGGQVCYLDGGLPASGNPHCVTKAVGFRIYASFEIYIQPSDTADLTFRDGSYMLARGGTYMIFQPFAPSSLDTIQASLDATFDILTIKELQDAITKYQQTGDTTGVDLGKLSNDMAAINTAAEKLLQQAEAGISAYTSAGKEAPRYLQLVSGGLETVAGAADKLGTVFGLVQLIENTGRFNYPFYRDKLNTAFKDYFESIARARKLPNGTVMYTPLDPGSSTYFNRAETLLRMFLRDGRTCFEETNWTAAFLGDGTFLITSPACGTVQWSKEEIASLIAAADTDILRREVLRPLIKDSLDWYNNVVGLFVPSEAALSFSLLTGSSKPQQVTVEKGRMRFEKLSALKRAIDAKVFKFPGAKVLVWGTAFEAEINTGGDGTAFVEEGMPVLANLNVPAPDSYGITWGDGDVPLVAPPGTAPLNVPYRTANQAPFVVDLTPNQGSAIAPGNFAVQIRFSQAMDANSVTTHGLITITTGTPATYYAGTLGGLPHGWDAITDTLLLTPTVLPASDTYQIALNLPPEVVSWTGISAAGTPITTTFAVVDPLGAGGGVITSPGGVSLTVPPTARAEIAYEIRATHVLSSPAGWYPADGQGYLFSPEGITFSSPATISLPVPEVREGAAVFRFTGAGWQELGGTPNGQYLQVETTVLGEFAVFWPKPAAPRFFTVYLPVVMHGVSSSAKPGVGGGWQCDPFSGGVSCGQRLKAVSFGAPGDGWAVGKEILLHYANGKWGRASMAELDLFDGYTPWFEDVDMLSAGDGWAVGGAGYMARYQNGVWHTSRPYFGDHYGQFYSIDMFAADYGWISGYGETYHYDGSAWQAVSVPANLPLYDIDVAAPGDVWAVGGDNFGNSVILHYASGSWQQVSSPVSAPLYGIDMLSTVEGWAVGQGGVILHYASGTWSPVSSPTTLDLNDVQMRSVSEGWAVSADGLIYHYQTGTWTEVSGQSPNNKQGLLSLAIVSTGEVWAVGELGRMFYSLNGITWEQFAGVPYDLSILSEWFNAIDMVSSTDGWAAGKLGRFIHYDGGSWEYAPSPTGYEITGLDMVSGSNGWAVAGANTSLPSLTVLLHYDGASWQVGQSQSNVHLVDVNMLSSTDGWAVGRAGIIMHYNGSSWGFVASPTLEDLNAVEMVSATEGWAVGDNGVILHYTGGAWEAVTSPTTSDLLDISVVSPLEAWAVGKDGALLRAFLGSWYQVPLPAGAGSPDINSIEMVSATEGWATGRFHPLLLHYQNGSWEVYALEWAGGYDIAFTPNGEGWMVGLWNYGLVIHYR